MKEEKWKKCCEALPHDERKVLVVDIYGVRDIALYSPRLGWCWAYHDGRFIEDIVGWIDLPEKPEWLNSPKL